MYVKRDKMACQTFRNKFLSTVGSEENAQAHAEATREVYEQFGAGAPIPPVGFSDLKNLWEVSRRMNADMPPQPGGAIGLSLFAAYGFEAASASPEVRVPIQLRCHLLTALVERGVLKGYLRRRVGRAGDSRGSDYALR
ncbi:MAG TPA: hypothetical protein VHQ22_08195 [Terriglobales bacterium]|nr:hypothetical protein [Terriglobales bacterium]